MTLAGIEGIHPLTPVQHGLLFHTLYEPGSSVYCDQVACRIDGDLDAAALRKAWEEVLRRQPALRTAFLWDGLQQPLQVVHERLPLPWVEQDWRALDAAEQARRWDQLQDAEWRTGFDPAAAPLLRLVLIRVADRAHHFLWTYHHLLLDGWSAALLVRDVQDLYEDFRRGRSAHPEVGRPYRDYLAWLAGQDLAAAEHFWRARLRGFASPTRLPLKHAAADAPAAVVDQELREIALSTEATRALKDFARRQRVSLNAVVQGAWALLLSHYSGEEEVVYGTTLSGRPATLDGVETMVGLFINSLPVRLRARGDMRVTEWLREVHAQQWDLQEHAHSPLVQVQGWSELPPGVPLFESLFVFENYPVQRAETGGAGDVTLRDIRVRARTNYPLSAVALPGAELVLQILHDGDRIEPAMAAAMLRQWQYLLERMTSDPSRRLADLSPLSEAEWRRAVFEWNATACDYPRDVCIPRLFEVQAERTPDAVAVSWGARRLGYAELNRRANRLARHLRASGATEGSLVGLHLRRSPELVIALLAVLKAGCAYVPLNTEYPAERLAMMLRDCAAPVVLTEDGLPPEVGHAVGARTVTLGELDEALAGLSDANLPGAPGPDQLAYVIYTSGSTGTPKGVAVPHRAVVRLVQGADFVQLGVEDRVAQASNAAFDAATFEIWGALLNGATLVGVARETTLSPPRLAELLRAERISTLFLTTALFNQVARDAPDAFAPVRHLLFGGEAVDPQLVRRVLAAGGPARLLHVYGPTENTTFSTWHLVETVPDGATTVPIGRAIANSQAYVLDRQMRPVPVGVIGELHVGGDGLAEGYLHRPDLTAEKFIPGPFAGGSGARLYRTGDLARYRGDGAIEFVGRTDGQVKIRGFRVELGEVEAALATHPAIREAAVVHAEGRLAAHVVPMPGAGIDRAELRRHLARLLPDHMLPADFAVLDALPLNANGKLDRSRLPPVPRGEGDQAQGLLRGATAEIVAGVWAEVLDFPEVGADDNFFERGGHSLLATQVISRLRAALAVELPLRLLFEAPVLADFAERAEAARRQHTTLPPPIRPVARDGPPALSFAQERLWFLGQLEPDNPFYVVPIALALKGRLDVPALEASLDAVVRRHEVLRTRFPAVDGRPAQVVAPHLPITLSMQDLGQLPEEERAREAERAIDAEARRPFDLAAGPLLRTRLLRLGPEDHVLLFTMHHIVADGWSLGVLVQEVAAHYPSFVAGKGPAPLPALPAQYADFAALQRDWLQAEELGSQLGYWKRQLAGAPPVLHLPTDRPRPSAQSYRGSSLRFAVEPEVAEGLRRLGRRRDATLFMVLLAAFATLLHRYSGQDDLVIGSPIANRNRTEIEPLIGFFVNTLALRAELSGELAFEDLLDRVRLTALDAYAHQDLPFERLVDELQPERDLSLNPLFQVMFTLQNAPLGRLELPGLSVELLERRHQAALFDLVLDMWETEGGGLHGILEYNTDLFDEDSAQRIARNFRTLLAAVVTDPSCRLGRLELLTHQQQAALLAIGQGERRNYPVTRSLHALFEEAAVRAPARVAARHNGRQLTYAELDLQADRIAGRLRRLGARPGRFVALLEDRGLDLLVAMLGALKAGAAFVPIDPAYPAERIRHMLVDSGAAVLVSRAARLAELPAGLHAGACLLLDADAEPAGAPDATGPAAADGEVTVTGDDLAYMLYTSGSTGLPKGAMVRHAGAVNHICAELELLGCDADLAFLQSAPSSSDISVWQFLGPLLAGGRTVVADSVTVADPAALLHVIRAEGITLIELVPAVLQALLDHAEALPPAQRAMPRLACAMVTGEAAPPGLVNRWLALYPGIPLVNAYGPTEAADDICQAVLDRPLSPDQRTVPIGRPLPNLTLYVLDREQRLLPLGVPGEICVSGIGVGAGYHGDPARTRQSFVPNPYAGDGRGEVLYRTGDLGRWLLDGSLDCLGRIDHQVKLRGFRIELGEIEGALCGHPALREAVASIVEDATGSPMLAAHVVPDPESVVVRAHLDDLHREQVGLWQDLHDDSYGDTRLPRGDAAFDTIGWDSNYTGLPLPEADMRGYVGFTVERIRALRPRSGPGRVLEIGCGTGLVMFPLLAHCESYTGTDLSPVTIARMRALQASPDLRARFAGLDRADLQCRRAEDYGWTVPGSHDTAVLASVVQYFPGVEYLLQVLDGLIGRALAPGGAIFLGDIRSLPLLEAFHASVQLHKADPADRSARLAGQLRQRLAQEQELAIEPGFFLALATRYPAIRAVEILPKRGTRANEMTLFRYDVLIRTGDGGEPVAARDLPWEDWDRSRRGLEQLRRRLAEQAEPLVALRRVANARIAEALAAAEHLLRGRGDLPAAEIRALATAAAASPRAGLEPEALWQLGQDCGYQVDLSLAAGHPDGSYDAVFRRRGDAAELPPLSWAQEAAPRPWARYANNPLQEKLGRRLAPELRDHLKSRLPQYMVPSSFTLLGSLPLTPVGKVDRQALPAPDPIAVAEGAYVAPRSPEEHALARIWAEVLGLPRVGIQQNFFELGGHSLKATQVISRIQRDLGLQLPLREVFSHPTIAQLALRLPRTGDGAPGRAAIPKAAEAESYPLSHGQRRLWVLSQLEGGSVAYNMPLALLLEGDLDVPAFQAAFARLVGRHEALRTVFRLEAGVPRQSILPAGAVALPELVDLATGPDPEAAARGLAQRDAATPFDLERDPPVRAALLRLAPARHVLLLTMHHIASDDWSMGVLVRDFVQLYLALTRGAEPDLPPLTLQYRDYACWQVSHLDDPAAAAHRAYWHARLSGELPVLQLPTDLPRPPVKTYRGRTTGFRFDARQAGALAALARGRGASTFMLLVALVKLLLFRLSGQDEILVGFPIAGRDHAELEGQVGFYVNTLPLRSRVDGEAGFLDLLDQVRVTATEAYEHQAYPFDRLVDELELARDASRSPMFDVAVIMQNAAPPAPPLAGVTVRPFLGEYGVSKFDLSFTFEEREDGLQVDITYNTDLFLPARIRWMAGHLRELAANLLAEPSAPVSRLRMLSAAERQEALAAGVPAAPPALRADTRVGLFEGQAAPMPDHVAAAAGPAPRKDAYVGLFERQAVLTPDGMAPAAASAPRANTLVALFERQAALLPDRIALVLPQDEAGPRQILDYATLNARANRLAHALRRLGVGPDALVALCLSRSFDLIVGMLGILKAGGAYLPLDPAHPAERQAFMAADARVVAVVTQDDLAGPLSGLDVPILRADRDAAMLAEQPEANPAPTSSAGSLAYVIYTSGSTGRPKGVAVTQRNVVRLFTSTERIFGFGAQDVWTLFHSCAFDFSVWEIWGALLHGGRLVVVPHAVSRSPATFRALLAREGVTVLNQTPSAFHQFAQADEEAAPAAQPLVLREVIFGGETLDPRSLRPWFARHGDARPRLLNMYGITETTVHVTCRPLSAADLEAPGSPIGSALPDLRLYILDPHGEPVPPGVVGELYVGGAGVARGYLHRPELTAERFVPDPFGPDPAARLYRTGDLARFRLDGDIDYCGRIDQQVQIRGFRVECGEVETALAAHPAVLHAIVLPDGEAERMRLLAYVVPAPGEAADPAALRRHLRTCLPDYMVPAAVIPIDALPLTANGKLDRVALPRPEAALVTPDAQYVAPEGALERQIAAVFQEVLGVGRVGLHDNFFDLGANSLLLVQVHRRLREALAGDLPVISLFRYPTVATLAAQLAAGEPEALAPQVDERVAARRRASRERRRAPLR